MASRLRPPPGSKLARPVGTGLKPPGSSKPAGRLPQAHSTPAAEKDTPQTRPLGAGRLPNAGGSQLKGPGGIRKPVGLVRPPGQVNRVAGGTVAGPATPHETGQASQETPPALEVGDKILVGGVKPGVIAFIGPTQFAKGVWAGIVLDSYDGKNNGFVGGVQYFDCEPNRGLFSRLEKLTLVAKASEGQPPKPQQLGAGSGAGSDIAVGGRVLVDGAKPGTVAFLGSTKFAHGVWVGVVLDTPEGKNDGSVAGVQYFECEANYGLFTRPQKLKAIRNELKPNQQQPRSRASSQTSQPPPEQDPASLHVWASSSQRSAQATPIDPERLRALREQLKIGDRVLVGGAKEGFLRYLGPTEFAKGVWAGVELEEPMGKNDGAVSGKRYFQCGPKYGLFAPLPKVEKLASAGSMDSSMEVSSAGAPASPTPPPSLPSPAATRTKVPPFQRRLSNSSTSSFGSSRQPQSSSATGLSELLEEKERTVVALQSSLAEEEQEKRKLQEQVTELSRQVEDLQFQIEEQGVISGDRLETTEEATQRKVKELEQQLREESQRAREELQAARSSESAQLGELRQQMEEARSRTRQQAEEHANALAARDGELSQVQSDLESAHASTAELRRQLKSAEDQSQQLSQDKSELEGRITQLSQLSGNSSEQLSFLDQQLKEKDRQLEDLHSQQAASIEETQKARDDLQMALERFSRESDQLTSSHSRELESAQAKLDQLTQELQQSKEALEVERQRGRSLETDLSQAEELQLDLTETGRQLQEARDVSSRHEALLKERSAELSRMQGEIRSFAREKDLWAGERERLILEQDRLTSERDKALSDCDRLMTESASASSEQNELARQRRELISERDQLMAERQVMRTEHERVLGEHDALLQTVEELQLAKAEVVGQTQAMNMQYDTTQTELSEAMGETERLRLELASIQENWEQEKLSLQEKLELAWASGTELQQRMDSVTEDRDSTLQQAQELADQLLAAEQKRDELQGSLASAQGQVNELQVQLHDLNKSHRALEREATAESSAIHQRLEATESLLAEKERELADAREKVTTLSDELVIAQRGHDQALLEEEKLLLEERVEELTLQLEKQGEQKRSSMVISEGERLEELDVETLSLRLQDAQAQLLEAEVFQENIQQTIGDYEQQVEFLNSVIADLQRKLETAEALAGLHGPLEGYADEDDEEGLEHLPPPRLFCDICDVFDEHDTDDCPTQTSVSDSPPHSTYHGARAPGGSDRPYCENCEVFGHATEECEYEATY